MNKIQRLVSRLVGPVIASILVGSCVTIEPRNATADGDGIAMPKSAQNSELIGTVSAGDRLTAKLSILGEMVRKREVNDPADTKSKIMILDFVLSNGFFENKLRNRSQIIKTKALEVSVKEGVILNIAGNPNNPTAEEASTMRGIPPQESTVAVYRSRKTGSN